MHDHMLMHALKHGSFVYYWIDHYLLLVLSLKIAYYIVDNIVLWCFTEQRFLAVCVSCTNPQHESTLSWLYTLSWYCTMFYMLNLMRLLDWVGGIKGILVVHYICYAQSSDWDNPRIVLRKPRIRVLHGQSPDWPSTHPRTTSCLACVRWLNNGALWGSWAVNERKSIVWSWTGLGEISPTLTVMCQKRQTFSLCNKPHLQSM